MAVEKVHVHVKILTKYLTEILNLFCLFMGLCNSVKNLPAMQETWSLIPRGEDALEKRMQPTPIFLLEN